MRAGKVRRGIGHSRLLWRPKGSGLVAIPRFQAFSLGIGLCFLVPPTSVLAHLAAVAQSGPLAIEVEALPIGDAESPPGSTNQLLLALHVRNTYPDARELTQLQVTPVGALAVMRLWRDTGDGLFNSNIDSLYAQGPPVADSWSAPTLRLRLEAGASTILFVSGDVSMNQARHGSTLDASVVNAGSLALSPPSDLAPVDGFPLNSAGMGTVTGFVLAQVTRLPQPSMAVAPGAEAVPLLQLLLPDDGGIADSLRVFEVRQLGTAVTGLDIQRMQLQCSTDGAVWRELVDLADIGGARYASSDISLAVPVGGLWVRVVADIGGNAQEARTIQLELPRNAVGFASGRQGPVDASWWNPGIATVQAVNALDVTETSVRPTTGPVPRSVTRLPVLGFTLTAHSAGTDTLVALRLQHTSTGPTGPALQSHAQVAAVELFHDVDETGDVSATDVLLATATLDSNGQILLGDGASLGLPLPVNVPVPLLVTLTPHPVLVRDAERLSVLLERGADVVTAGALEVRLAQAIGTSNPPVIDGQGASGYGLQSREGQIVFPSTTGVAVLDFALPSNGVDADILQGIRVENAGTATSSDIAQLSLFLDDGDGNLGASDSLLTVLNAIGGRTWSASGLSLFLPAASSRHVILSLKVAEAIQSGRTFRFRIPLNGITVASANDGPTDLELIAAEPFVSSASDRFTWFSGVTGSGTVAPNVEKRILLTIESFNNYPTPRTLQSLSVSLLGTARESEFRLWGLYPDDNRNGVADDKILAFASPESGELHFSGFDYVLAPLEQKRFLITYSLDLAQARDASLIDAAIESADAIGFDPDAERTESIGAFPLNSPGLDTVDGMLLEQLGNHTVSPQAISAGDTNILVLDVVVPANGSDPDRLESLVLVKAMHANSAGIGVDIVNVQLWREVDADFTMSNFDPTQDQQVSTGGGPSSLTFDGLSELIPAGGARFYVTIDVTPTATNGRVFQLTVPILGVQMASGNDGPLDNNLTDTVTHTISSSDLLVSVLVAPRLVSRSETVDVDVIVRNRGTATDGIVPLSVDAQPAGVVTLLSGPHPDSLNMASGATDTLSFSFAVNTPGDLRFTAVVGRADSSIVSEPATSPTVRVEEPPTAVILNPLSTLPSSVNRGQLGIPVLVWRFAHPDTDPIAASIRIDEVSLMVEDGNGIPLVASEVLSRIDIRTGGLVHASWNDIPATTTLTVPLAHPIELEPGDTWDVPLTIGTAAASSVSDFRVRLADDGAVRAVDANSGAAVAVQALLPWTTQSATLLTPAPYIELAASAPLASRANRGQLSVLAGHVTFTLPGAVGASEARITALTLQLRDQIGDAILTSELLAGVRVTSGLSLLLQTSNPSGANGTLELPLEIPKAVVSGAPESVDFFFDLRADSPVQTFSVVFPDSSVVEGRDPNSGVRIPARATGSFSFPWTYGPVELQDPASLVALDASSLAPQSNLPTAEDIPAFSVTLAHQDPVGSASVVLTDFMFGVTDSTFGRLVPNSMISAAALLQGNAVLAQTNSPPSVGSQVGLTLSPPLEVMAGEAVTLTLHVTMANAPGATSVRFVLDAGGIVLLDANDTARTIAPTGEIPFATRPMRVLSLAAAVAVGPLDEPPANVPSGVDGFPLLTLRLLHPGLMTEVPIQAQELIITCTDADGAPLVVDAVARTAHLRVGDTEQEAGIFADSLRFDLSSLPELQPQALQDLSLEFDLQNVPVVADFRLALDSSGLRATSRGNPIAVSALPGRSLPYQSATVHLGTPALEASFTSYPNPFRTSQGSCHVTFYLSQEARVTCDVYTLSGQRVYRLLDDVLLQAGMHDELEWDGRNGEGRLVRSGTYLLRLKADGVSGGEIIRKLAVIR